MSELQLIRCLVEILRRRLERLRLGDDRGDVAEKIVIVGIFVVLAITVGALIVRAVTEDATRIAHQIGVHSP
jgi:hypothetical protein